MITDPSDIWKKYARKMECLGRVRDGSQGVIAEGFWTCQVVAANPIDKQSTPIYGSLYSIDSKDTTSENREILRPVRKLCKLAPRRAYFACAVLDSSTKLKLLAIKALGAGKRIFGIPDFRYYAIDAGNNVNISPLKKLGEVLLSLTY